MENIELDEEMEMPCLCSCGAWFDLNDGVTDPKTNKVLCVTCGELAEEIFNLEEEIEVCKDEIECHKSDLKYEKKRLEELTQKLKKLQQ